MRKRRKKDLSRCKKEGAGLSASIARDPAVANAVKLFKAAVDRTLATEFLIGPVGDRR